jgi:hypothetical protein
MKLSGAKNGANQPPDFCGYLDYRDPVSPRELMIPERKKWHNH